MILCGGENLIDLIPEPPAEDGGLRYRAVPGGAPCNCARALARLGMASAYLGPLSGDGPGQLLAATLAADGVALAGGRTPHPTALAVVSPGPGGEPQYVFHRNATADRQVTAEGLCARLPEAATALCLSGMALSDGPDAAAWEALAEAAQRRGLALVIDPNIRPAALPADPAAFRARLARLCARADLVKLSQEDAAWMAPEASPEAAAAALLAAAVAARGGAPLVVLTCGAEGAVALAPGQRLARPAVAPSPLADTVGAGDSFLAGLLSGLAGVGALHPRGMGRIAPEGLGRLLDSAAAAAAVTCSRRGCDPPWRHELP